MPLPISYTYNILPSPNTQEEVKFVKDAVPAILIPMLLFVLPSERPKKNERVERLLDWKTAQSKMPWNVIMLLGGGFALAKGLWKVKFYNVLDVL